MDLIAVGQMGSANSQAGVLGSQRWMGHPIPAAQSCSRALQSLFILLAACKGLIGKSGVWETEEKIYRLLNLKKT